MLDNIDLDFDQSHTTSTKQKYTNCTNDIKADLADLKGYAAAIEEYSGVFFRSPLNPDGTNNKVWIELLEKAKLGRNYVWEATSAFPGLKGVSKTWDTYNTNDFSNSVQMEQLRYDSCLFYRKSRTSRTESRKTYQRLPGDRTWPERWALSGTSKEHSALVQNRQERQTFCDESSKLEKGYELQNEPFLNHEIAVNLEMENAKTSLIPESISQQTQDDNDQLPTPSDTRILRTHVDKAMYLSHQRPDIQHSVNTLLRSMRNPTTTTIQKLKKLISYLLRTSNVYQKSTSDDIEGCGALELLEEWLSRTAIQFLKFTERACSVVSDDRMSWICSQCRNGQKTVIDLHRLEPTCTAATVATLTSATPITETLTIETYTINRFQHQTQHYSQQKHTIDKSQHLRRAYAETDLWTTMNIQMATVVLTTIYFKQCEKIRAMQQHRSQVQWLIQHSEVEYTAPVIKYDADTPFQQPRLKTPTVASQSKARGSDFFNSSVTYDVQTKYCKAYVMVRYQKKTWTPIRTRMRAPPSLQRQSPCITSTDHRSQCQAEQTSRIAKGVSMVYVHYTWGMDWSVTQTIFFVICTVCTVMMNTLHSSVWHTGCFGG